MVWSIIGAIGIFLLAMPWLFFVTLPRIIWHIYNPKLDFKDWEEPEFLYIKVLNYIKSFDKG